MNYLIFIWMIFLICLVAFPKSKFVGIIFIGYLTLIGTFNLSVSDRANYFIGYNNVDSASWERGFEFLIRIFNFMNIPFTGFVFSLILVSLIIMGSLTFKYARFPNVVLVLYSIFPFMYDVTQLRSMVAGAVICFAVSLLYENKTYQYIVLLIVAISIHNVSIFFFILLLAKLPLKKIIKLFIIFISIMVLVIQYLLPLLARFIPNLAVQINRYSIQTHSDRVLFLMAFFIILTTAFSLYTYYAREKNKFNLFLIKVILLTSLSFIFVLINLEFFRIFRVILLFVYILVTQYIPLRRNSILIDVIYNMGIIAIPLSLFMVLIYNNYYDTILVPLIYENLLIY